MSNMTPEEIRKLPMRRDLPYNGLTREQVIAIGGDPDVVETGRLASIEHAQAQEQRHAAELVAVAQNAVAEGQATNAEIAAALLINGQSLAHDMFVAEWQKADHEDEVSDTVDWIIDSNSDTYLAFIEQQREEHQAKALEDLQEAQTLLAQAQIKQAYEQLVNHVRSTPGAHESADAVKERLDQLIVEGQGAGLDSAQGQQRLIAQAIHDVALRDSISSGLTEQVEVEHRAFARHQRDRNLTERKSDDRSPQQRAADEETWKLARLQELAESTPIDPSVRELPPSPEEVAAAERAKYEEKQQKSTSYQQQVADIAERGKEANATRDRGEGISEEKRAYREALQRAEDAALYGEFAEVKSGYGDNAVQPKATSEQLDEFGGAFPGYENA